MESTVDKSFLFPPEILTEIFGYVDPHTLVFSCRHVCRLWRDTVQCPAMWKLKLYQTQGHKFATDNALSKAHLNYPWYVCYALCRNVFNTDLFVRSKGIPQFERYAGAVWPQNEGCLCVYGGPVKNYSVDLYAQGLTKKIMEHQPSIQIIDWFHYNVDCPFNVRLYDSGWRCCSEHIYFTSQEQMEWGKLCNVSHTFRNYSPNVRYVVFLDGIDTYSGLLRNIYYAKTMTVGTRLFVGIPEVSHTFRNYSPDVILHGIHTYSGELMNTDYIGIKISWLSVGTPKPRGPSNSNSSNSLLRVPLQSFVNIMQDSCI